MSIIIGMKDKMTSVKGENVLHHLDEGQNQPITLGKCPSLCSINKKRGVV
jgi:hypothetical protein